MIETILIDYLTEALNVPVYMEVPENAPENFVVLEKTGSSRSNHIEAATVAVQSYAPSLYGAAQLNQQVKDAMEAAIALDDMGRVSLNTDYNFTDTTTKRYRYQAVFDIIFY